MKFTLLEFASHKLKRSFFLASYLFFLLILLHMSFPNAFKIILKLKNLTEYKSTKHPLKGRKKNNLLRCFYSSKNLNIDWISEEYRVFAEYVLLQGNDLRRWLWKHFSKKNLENLATGYICRTLMLEKAILHTSWKQIWMLTKL